MPIDSYETTQSPPCRIVRLAAAALGVELNLKQISFENQEHLTPEYLKMNPQHTIPTINDNGFIMSERFRFRLDLDYAIKLTRAIITYLANQYGKDDSLYPKDPKKRALVDQRLYFDACTLYKVALDYYYPIVMYKAPKDSTKYVAIGTALSFLEQFLEGQDYVAGKTMTLADLAIVVTISTLEVLNYDLSKYKNVIRWFARIKSEAPNYEDNDAGAKKFKQWSEDMMKN
ncbi:Glutathione S-transferase 1-1 [Melipona quadrifasciata]|uniref:Glutathione S-transferase 1-1 n=1 Tax=Melipona quadrifasciata TaxID=166423 RepID=A0A0N0BJY6_9HYME|nr:Glutathione S-transferase 1-1 [Melipona quadrifasciata]